MTHYILGIDIGATKSHALVADETGQVLGFGLEGPGSHESIGYDGLAAVMNRITQQALQQAGITIAQICGAGFGLAGYDLSPQREPTDQAIHTMGLAAPFEAVNDAVIGLVAGAEEGWGVVIIAGTGENCRGRDRQGREGRVLGCGYFSGENGGSGSLVQRALEMVTYAWVRRGPSTQLTQAFIERTDARDPLDMLEGLHLDRYRIGAEAAPLVFQVAQQGDYVAQEVIAWAGRELAGLAVGVIRQLNFEALQFDVVLAGSLFKGGSMLIEPLRATISEVAPKARLVRLAAPPVVGAVLLGMQQAGLTFAEARQRLLESARAYVE